MKMIRLKSIVTLLTPYIIFLYGMLMTFVTFARDATDEIEMANPMYESGKIYVVVAVLVVIFIGIVVYLVIIDRKVSKLEKMINE